MPEHEDWRGSTAGATWMHRSLMAALRVIGVVPVYVFMGIFVVPVYMIVNHKGYISIYHYMRRRQGFGVWKSFWKTYQNHYRFGQVVIDRFAFYAGKKFDFELIGNERFLELMDGEEGFAIISSHVGNYEIAGYTFTSTKKKYNALVYGGEAKTVMENRSKFLTSNNIHMIIAGDDMAHVIELNNALAEGGVVSIPGDRIFGSPRSIECDFLGGKAKFPLGPYAMATQRDNAVIGMFVMKEATYKYKVYIRELKVEGGETMRKSERAKRLAQVFASEMEKVLREYPEQWYNYYEFWEDGGERA